MRYLQSVFYQLVCLCFLSHSIPAQEISFFPVTDTIKVIYGCTDPEIICTVSAGTYLDSVFISPGFNTRLEYLDSTRQYQYLDQCYYLITDSLNELEYEVWYFPLGMLPYFQQIPFDSTFVTWEEYYELMLIVKSQGIPLDSMKQFFKTEGGLGIKNDKPENLADQILLYPNYPNPFNGSTMISFYLPRKMLVKLSVYNVVGQLVESIIDNVLLSGQQIISWDAGNLNSGIYYLWLTNNDHSEIQKCMVIK